MKEILYFSAPWCGPCKHFKPIMENVSNTIPVRFINVDETPQLATQYGIRSVPTVIIINNGQVTNKKAGVLTEIQIKSLWSQN